MSVFHSTASVPDRRPVSIPTTGASEMTATPRTAPGPTLSEIDPKPLPQYSFGKILAVWAGAALPMAAMAWVVAPVVAGAFADPTAWPKALALSLTAGLIWQFVLVLLLVHQEQGTLRWSVQDRFEDKGAHRIASARDVERELRSERLNAGRPAALPLRPDQAEVDAVVFLAIGWRGTRVRHLMAPATSSFRVNPAPARHFAPPDARCHPVLRSLLSPAGGVAAPDGRTG
jgi:hypothetical protein